MVEHMFEDVGIPKGLAQMTPGPKLAAILSSIDRNQITGHDRVVLVQAWNRQVAHDQAELYAAMVAVADAEQDELSGHLESDEISDLASSEIRAALTLTRRAADTHLGWATQLVEDYPLLWEALRQGLIDLPKAKVIITGTCHLEPEHRTMVTAAAMEWAPQQTTGQLDARIRRLVIRVDPDAAKTRYEEAVKERRVISEANPDGTANLRGLNLAPHRVGVVMRRINRLARAARSADDPRTMDQIRADVLLDLLNGNTNHDRQHRGTVDIRVDLTTLAGLVENPGELAGYGPVIADIARQVTTEQSDAEWRYTITNQEGQVIHNGTTRRRPDAELKRQVEAENPTCVFPGCRNPAAECDIDHNQPWSEAGPTEVENLAPLCRHDHVVRHHGWTIKQTRPGIYEWTSPLGHTYKVLARSP